MSPLETICLTCQILFSRKIKQNISLLSAEFAHSIVSVNPCPAEPGYTLPLPFLQKPTDLDLHCLPSKM